MLHSLNAPGIVKDGTGMAGAREGARHRADWLSRIDLAGEGVRVEAVDAVGGGDPHVDSLIGSGREYALSASRRGGAIELYVVLDPDRDLQRRITVPMKPHGRRQREGCVFSRLASGRVTATLPESCRSVATCRKPFF